MSENDPLLLGQILVDEGSARRHVWNVLVVVDEAQMISRVELLDSVAHVLLNLLGSRHSSSWAALRCVPASSDIPMLLPGAPLCCCAVQSN